MLFYLELFLGPLKLARILLMDFLTCIFTITFLLCLGLDFEGDAANHEMAAAHEIAAAHDDPNDITISGGARPGAGEQCGQNFM